MPLKVVSVDIVKHELRGCVEDKQISPQVHLGFSTRHQLLHTTACLRERERDWPLHGDFYQSAHFVY